MIGIDEVGRGAWAGPLLVVAAREKADLPAGLKDSKKLSKTRRQKLLPLIEQSCELGEGWVTAGEIDELGLNKAMQLAVRRALLAINANDNEQIILDGLINYCPKSFTDVTCLPRADDTFQIVSAASIAAKVKRDNYMANLPAQYVSYGFASHVGYGTADHLKAIIRYGLCDLHRRSFEPVKKFAKV